VSDKHEANEQHEEGRIEPAVLYQPLGEASDVLGLDAEWRRIFIEYGSRCEQYGGHWKGHKCVGVRNHGGGSKSACESAGAAGAATVVVGLVPEDLPWATVAAAVVAGYGAWSLEHIEHHNCIGAEVWIGDKLPRAGYYRSKKECE
jgi:hypothetical protein